jgi:hypothetical protein
MDRHSGYVGLSRHRDGVQLHYGRDDFADQGRLARVLSRDRGKDMAGDYAPDRSDQDHARAFADRREIRFPERARQVVEKVRDKARGMFAGFRPKPATGKTPEADRGGAAIGTDHPDQARAIERYARAAADIGRMRDQGLPVLPHQETALRKAGEGLDAVRPHAARDLASALARDPKLIEQAAGPRITMKSTGRMKRISGTVMMAGKRAAFSSARIMRSLRNSADRTRSADASGVPYFSVWIMVVTTPLTASSGTRVARFSNAVRRSVRKPSSMDVSVSSSPSSG